METKIIFGELVNIGLNGSSCVTILRCEWRQLFYFYEEKKMKLSTMQTPMRTFPIPSDGTRR